jgi:hypothetical protein
MIKEGWTEEKEGREEGIKEGDKIWNLCALEVCNAT